MKSFIAVFLFISFANLGFADGPDPVQVNRHRHELIKTPPESALQEAALWVQQKYDPSKWLIIGDVAFFRSDEALAMQLLNGLPETVSDGERYLYKGILSKTQGDRTTSENYFEIVTRDPNRLFRAKGFYFLGELTYLALKDPEVHPRELERGHYFFQKAIESSPALPEAYFGIARRFIHLQNWTEAIDYLELAVKADSKDFLSHYHLGIIFAEKKLWTKAFKHLKEAHQLRKADLKTMRELVLVASQAGEKTLATDMLETYISYPSVTSAEALPIIKQVLFRKIERDFYAGQVKRALDQYLQLEKRFPEVPEIAIRIGICYRELGKSYYGRSKVYFQSYIQKRSKDHVGYFELGILKFRDGSYVHAARQFIKALQLHPRDNGNIWLWTAKSLETLELIDEAMFVLNKAEIQPQLEVQYRQGIENKLKEFEHKYKTSIAPEMTFSVIEHRLISLLDQTSGLRPQTSGSKKRKRL